MCWPVKQNETTTVAALLCMKLGLGLQTNIEATLFQQTWERKKNLPRVFDFKPYNNYNIIIIILFVYCITCFEIVILGAFESPWPLSKLFSSYNSNSPT